MPRGRYDSPLISLPPIPIPRRLSVGVGGDSVDAAGIALVAALVAAVAAGVTTDAAVVFLYRETRDRCTWWFNRCIHVRPIS